MFFKVSAFIISCVLVLPLGFSQSRDRYKESSEFKPTARPAQPVQANQPEGNEQAEQDFFGRGTGIQGVTKTPEQEKYVNLNPETAFGPEIVTSFDFPDVSLDELTKHMQKLTGINLIWDKDIKGKISILAPTPITVGDAWKAYLTALNVNGLTLVKSGAFYKIVQAREARSTPTKIYTGAFTPDVENYVMKIIPVKNIKSSEIQRNFRPFMSKYGRIIDIKQTNTIIVHDTGANINRLVKLIRFLDVPGFEESLHIIPVVNSSAQEIAKLLDTILKGGGSGSGAQFRGKTNAASSAGGESNISKIIAEPRTNSIIAMANADGYKQLQMLIKKLDVKFTSQSADKIHVYYLNYGNAKDLAQTLSNLVSGAQQQSNSRTSRLSRRLSQNQDTESNLFSADIKITADEPNNAIVVTASPTDWLTIEQVIKKLDIPRDQVYVEGLIMETIVRRSKEFGISLVGAYGTGAGQKAGFNTAGGVVDLVSNNLTNLSGLFVGGGTGKTVELTVGDNTFNVDSVTGLIRALADNVNTDVLATPQILALDNEEAEFEVGDRVPFTNAATVANGTTQNNTEFQDVTLKLKITPQINKVTRFIKLKIDQNIQDFSNRGNANPGGGAATTTRRALTTVVVRDRDTIAMGGLMRDKHDVSENKIPLLGDIPVLGWLFRAQSDSIEKVNLLFFLTPRILSPYETTVASNLRDVVNRRAAHMKSIHGENDPFGATMKGLHKKSILQADGPLYDEVQGARFFQNQNKDDGIGGKKGNPQDENDLGTQQNSPFDPQPTTEQDLDSAFNEAARQEHLRDLKALGVIPDYKAIARDAKRAALPSNNEDIEEL